MILDGDLTNRGIRENKIETVFILSLVRDESCEIFQDLLDMTN